MALSKSPTVAEARGASCRALFDCVWIECDDMELSLPPCCRGLLWRTISNSPDGKKARKSKNSVQKRTAIFLAKAKVFADSGDAASTADDVASRTDAVLALAHGRNQLP